MRNRFDEQLEKLNNDLIAMGSLCETAIARACKALTKNDAAMAKEAILADDEIDQMERDIEDLCLRLLLQQQPVARDLRLISSALKMITDMERIGDQAADIAEIVSSSNLSHYAEIIPIPEMAKATIAMVTDSIDAYVKRDLEMAKGVLIADDVVDSYFIKIRDDLIELIAGNKTMGAQALDILMIVKYLERIGDHATNIAGWVVFSITGEHGEVPIATERS